MYVRDLPIVSLYGRNKKPTTAQMAGWTWSCSTSRTWACASHLHEHPALRDGGLRGERGPVGGAGPPEPQRVLWDGPC